MTHPSPVASSFHHMSSTSSETPYLYKWTNICPPLCHLSLTKLSSLEETMMQPCPPCSKAHQITSPSIIRDGKSPPPNTPFNGLLETPTVQWMDPDNALFKYQVPTTPPLPVPPVPQNADVWSLGDTVCKDLEPLLNHTDLWEKALGSAIAGACHLAMQALKTSLQKALRILPLCQVPIEGTSLWDQTTMLNLPLAVDMLL